LAKKKRKVPANFWWYKVNNCLIPNENHSYEVAAAHKDQACTIVSAKFGIQVYLEDSRTSVERIGPVTNNHCASHKILPKKIDDTANAPDVSEGRICPNPKCGYIDASEGADTCPGCGTGYPVESYSVHIRGEL